MNILKLNRFFYLFITLAVVGVLVTSCEREIIIEEDLDGFKTSIIEDEFKDNTQLKILIQNVSESNPFKEIYRIDSDIFNKLETIVSENDFSEITEKLEYDNVKHIFDQYEGELVSSLKQLSQQFPELGNLEEDQLKHVYETANLIIESTEENIVNRSNPCFTNTGDCGQDCYNCYRYLNAQDYANYRSRRYYCIQNGGSWNYCNTLHYQYYLDALPGNYDYYLSCYAGC